MNKVYTFIHARIVSDKEGYSFDTPDVSGRFKAFCFDKRLVNDISKSIFIAMEKINGFPAKKGDLHLIIIYHLGIGEYERSEIKRMDSQVPDYNNEDIKNMSLGSIKEWIGKKSASMDYMKTLNCPEMSTDTQKEFSVIISKYIKNYTETIGFRDMYKNCIVTFQNYGEAMKNVGESVE